MSDGRMKKTLNNSMWGLINIGVTTVLSFVRRSAFIFVFNAELLGINGLFSNILSILSLADMGFSTAMAYSYYKPMADGDEIKIAKLNNFYRKVYNYVAIVITALGLTMIPFLKYFSKLELPISSLNYYGSYLIFLGQTVTTYLFVYKSALYTANQKEYRVTRIRTITSMIFTVLEIAILLLVRDYLTYLSITLISNIVTNCAISFKANKDYPYICKSREKLEKKDKVSIISNLKAVFIYRLSGTLINSTDNILISTMVGTVFVGLYSNYLIIINSLTTFINVTFRSMIASLGNVMVTESEAKKYSVFKSVQFISIWFCIVFTASVSVVINDFILAWIGPKYVFDLPTVVAIMLNFYLVCALQPVWIFREAAGIYLKTKYVMLLTAILNLILSIVLGYWIGISGVLFASAISKLVTYVWYEPILLYKDYFKKRVSGYFLTQVIMLCATGALIVGLWFLLQTIVISNLWIRFFVRGVIAFIITNIVFLIVFARTASFRDLCAKLKSLFKLSLHH